MQAEVAMINRNIVIEGEEFLNQKERGFGGRILVSSYNQDGIDYNGKSNCIHYV